VEFFYFIELPIGLLHTQPIFTRVGAGRTRWTRGPYFVHATVGRYNVASWTIQTQAIFPVVAIRAKEPRETTANCKRIGPNYFGVVAPNSIPGKVTMHQKAKNVFFIMNCVQVMVKIQFPY